MSVFIVKIKSPEFQKCAIHKHRLASHYLTSKNQNICLSCAEHHHQNGAIEITEYQWDIYRTIQKFKGHTKHIKETALYLGISESRVRGIIKILKKKGVLGIGFEPLFLPDSKSNPVPVGNLQYEVYKLVTSPKYLLEDRFIQCAAKEFNLDPIKVVSIIKRLRRVGIKIPTSLERYQNRYNYILEQIKIQHQEKLIDRKSLIKKIRKYLGYDLKRTQKLVKKVEEDSGIKAWQGTLRSEILALLEEKSKLSLTEICILISSTYRSIYQSTRIMINRGLINREIENGIIYLRIAKTQE